MLSFASLAERKSPCQQLTVEPDFAFFMICQTISHYKILAKLGEGGMGVVYKAEDIKLKREVAIKFLPQRIAASEDERARFKIEAQAAAALNHPNIATIYAIEEVDDELFIVMEFIDGQELKKKVISDQLSVNSVIDIATQIAEGLKAAHAKGITHRDIKSSNIMVTESGQVKIMDFGLAKMSGDIHLTKAGITLGTAAYMSPEQARGEEVDQRTDIWAFGVVLYEMLTGQLPFRAEYEAAMMYSILNEEPQPLANLRSDVPAALTRIVARTLSKQAEQRYQTMADLLVELQEAKSPEVSFKSTEGKSRQTASATPERLSTKSAVAERRQVTAMFCDLTAASATAEPLDPEDLHHALPAYRQLCAKVIARFDGHVAQQLGNDILVYFGYPTAYEDSPRRAVLAGLGILEGIQFMNARLIEEKEIKLSVRLGIHTGLAIVGDQYQAASVVGEASDIAGQLLRLVDAEALVISQTTYRLIAGYFDCRELGAYALKGLAQPMALYQVLHESTARSRLEAAGTPSLTALTGRDKEIGMLKDRWQQTMEGLGQIVLLSGEAGIGKSRLAREIKEHVAANPQAWLTECYCSPYFQSTALYPIIDLFERVILQFKKAAPAAEKLNKLEGFLVQYGFSLPETVPLFAALLNVPLGENYAPLNLTPERQKQKTLAALLNLLMTRAAQQPLLFVIEDLHWVDPTTLELLNLIVDQGPAVRCMTLLTFRPDFTPPWPMRSHVAHLSLSRLSRHEVESLAEHVAKKKSLPKEVLAHIASKTDGVPLFVEELTKTVLESGVVKEKNGQYELTGALTQLAIPATLRDSLMARLDRLAAAKEVAQLGATLGREFPYEWLQAISPLDETTLQQELNRLVEAELLFRRGVLAQATYIFKHALIQEAAYESLLKSQRQQYHQQIAQALTEHFPQTVETRPELLAHHFTAAGLIAPAIPFWQKAGQHALQRSANLEAIVHLTRALELLKTLPDSSEKIQQELLLQITLGPGLIATRGFGATEVGEVYQRAGEICRQLGDTPLLFPALWGQWVYNLVRANLQTARALAEQILRLGESKNDDAMLVEGHWTLGNALFWLGNFANAEKHLQKALQFYKPEKHHAHAFIFGQDPAVAAHCYLSYVFWFMGYPDQALRKTEEALTMARALNHPFSVGWALAFGMMVGGLLRDPDLALERTTATISYCTEQAYPFWITASMIIQGWARCEKGRSNEGIELMRQGISGFQAIGSNVVEPLFQGILAEALGKAGQIQEGLDVVGKALTKAQKNEEKTSELDLHRIKGELLLAASEKNHVEAEACFLRAMNLAKSLNAKTRELQAALSLSRLRKQQGKLQEARTMLAEICGWFTEGFETTDLKEAKAMLGELKGE